MNQTHGSWHGVHVKHPTPVCFIVEDYNNYGNLNLLHLLSYPNLISRKL